MESDDLKRYDLPFWSNKDNKDMFKNLILDVWQF